MLGEGAAVGEGFLAKTAAIRTLPGMRAHVRRDGGRLRETPVADRTPEWLLTAVRPDVRRQVGRLRKGFVAIDAPVRFLAAVSA